MQNNFLQIILFWITLCVHIYITLKGDQTNNFLPTEFDKTNIQPLIEIFYRLFFLMNIYKTNILIVAWIITRVAQPASMKTPRI